VSNIRAYSKNQKYESNIHMHSASTLEGITNLKLNFMADENTEEKSSDTEEKTNDGTDEK
jgi:hypothetical protein